MQRLILNREFVDVLVFRSVVVNGPARRAQHQIAGLPFVPLSFDRTVSAAVEIIIHGGRNVTMWTVDNVLRTDRDGRKERVRRSVSAASGRVIHQIETPADVALAQIPKLV